MMSWTTRALTLHCPLAGLAAVHVLAVRIDHDLIKAN